MREQPTRCAYGEVEHFLTAPFRWTYEGGNRDLEALGIVWTVSLEIVDVPRVEAS